MKLSPETIREQRFRKRMRGYDPQEVLAFLLDMAEDMETLIDENSRLRDEIEAMRARQGDIENLLVSIRQFSDERIQRAESEAASIVAQAQAKAAEIQGEASRKIAEAERRAQETIAQTMRKAKEALRDAERSRQELERSIEELARRRSDMLAQVQAAVESCRAWLQSHVVS